MRHELVSYFVSEPAAVGTQIFVAEKLVLAFKVCSPCLEKSRNSNERSKRLGSGPEVVILLLPDK